VVLVVVVVVGIAGFVISREARRLTDRSFAPVFDEDVAFEWVVAELPGIVAATLTPEDVRRILRFQSDYLEQRGVTSTTVGAEGEDVVVGDAEVDEYILARARAAGAAYLPEQVSAVIETQMRYLQAIGAVGPEVPPGEISTTEKPRD